MIHLLDGPAADVALYCGRAPQLLRVVCTTRGEWDALDQPEDTPHRHELIHVYHRVRLGSPMFIDWRDRAGRRRGCRCADADYRFLTQQPDEDLTRHAVMWMTWCRAMEACTTELRTAMQQQASMRQGQLFNPPASLPDVDANRR